MVFRFVRTVVFDAFGILNSAQEHRVTLFPAIFMLQYSGIHVSISNGHNILSNIEVLVNKALSPATALDIPNINPNDRYVGFR